MSETPRYSAVAIALHWAIALGIIGMILLGWNMDDSEFLFQLHKSIGITILMLTIARIIWRLMNPPPPLPAEMKGYERTLSHVVHMSFYGLMLLMPLTGWLVVSTAYEFDIATVIFGTISWPDIPGVDFLSNEPAHDAILNVHSKLAWVAIILLGLHVAGAVKHEISAEEGVLKRMLPGLFGKTGKPTPPPHGFIAAFGAAIGVFVLIAFVPSLFSASAPTPPIRAAAGDDTSSRLAANWTVDYGASSIEFSGTHDGSEYEGAFNSWTADIRFDPEALDSARVNVTVLTASAAANRKLYTDTLKAGEWFAPSQYPEATVELANFRETGDGYTADATLTIKDVSVTVPFTFELEIDGNDAHMEGRATVARTPLDLGQQSDAGADWVGEDVLIEVEVRASRTG